MAIGLSSDHPRAESPLPAARYAFRFRLGRPSDLAHCEALLPTGFRTSSEIRVELQTIWRSWFQAGMLRFIVIENMEGPAANEPEGFGMSLFVTESFIEDYLRSPVPHLAAEIYKATLSGRQVVLTPVQVRTLNSTSGLVLVPIHGNLRSRDFSDPRTMQSISILNQGFFFLHVGYNLHTIVGDIYGSTYAEFMTRGGHRLLYDFQQHEPAAYDDVPPDEYPFLAGQRREWLAPMANSMLTDLFTPVHARIIFPEAERRLLERALLNMGDAEIAAELGVSQNSVKMTWRSIHARVERRAPFLVPPDDRIDPTGRAQERRRHVLEYLRTHLEELRPFSPRAAAALRPP